MHEQLLTRLRYVTETYMPMYPQILKELLHSPL